MKTIIELEQSIIDLTAKIQDKYPELSKYIAEMPQNNAEDEEINSKNLKKYYHSLEDILAQYGKTHVENNDQKVDKIVYADNHIYPPSEDIYQQFTQETDLNPDDLSKNKTPNEKEGMPNEKGFRDDMSGSDLDVPGSELDDHQESVGSEDEENNYYSIGGDKHNN